MSLLHKLDAHWQSELQDFLDSETSAKLFDFVEQQYNNQTVFPDKQHLFSALNAILPSDVSVVILGQDPYHAPHQAMGLAFSAPVGISIPPSLKNIYKEIESDTETPSQCLPDGDLTPWAKQGVLLLNSILTVEHGSPGSHANKGWEEFTDLVINKLAQERENIVFLLWGNYAKQKGSTIDRKKHLVLETSHPSPLGVYRGFNGCKHFTKTNQYLARHHIDKIVW